MANYSKMTQAQIQAEMAQVQKELDRRGGPKKAPGFAKQLKELQAAQAKMPQSPVAPPPAETPVGMIPENPNGGYMAQKPAIPGAGGTVPLGGPGGSPVSPGGAIKASEVLDTLHGSSGVKTEGTAPLLDAEYKGADYEAQQGTVLTNPNQIMTGGQRNVTIDPATGQPTIKDTLSAEQQAIYDRGAQLSGTGLGMANSRLSGGGLNSDFSANTIARTSTGDLAADRARIEDQVYARLTKDMDSRKAMEMQQTESTLANRGIPYSADPKSRYQQELKAVNDRYDSQALTARQTAAETGGTEYQRNFGINEQTIANQTSQQLAARNQNIGEIGTLANTGPGQTNPQFQGFQAANYNPANASEVYGLLAGIQDENLKTKLSNALGIKQINAQKEIARMNNARSSSGGGGGDEISFP